MSRIEVILTDLSEEATKELAKEHRPFGLKANKKMQKLVVKLQKLLKKILKESWENRLLQVKTH